MATKTQIANMAMTRLGEAVFTDVDSDGTNPADVVNAIWDIVNEEMLNAGPEEGWKFARWRISSVDVDSSAITAFADYSGTVTGTVLATSATHDLITGDFASISGGSVGSYDGNHTTTRVDANSFYFTATFVSTETATAQWTSQEYLYRFARPTSTRVTGVRVGGVELTDWIREGEWILTSGEDTAVDMMYIKALADLTVTNFPPHYVNILWRNLAIHLTYDLVQNSSMQQQLITELEQVYLPRAIGMDNRAQYVQESTDSWADIGRRVSSVEGDFATSPNYPLYNFRVR